jgi:hypothetical protein
MRKHWTWIFPILGGLYMLGSHTALFAMWDTPAYQQIQNSLNAQHHLTGGRKATCYTKSAFLMPKPQVVHQHGQTFTAYYCTFGGWPVGGNAEFFVFVGGHAKVATAKMKFF